jgi:hypothetical protein
MENKLNMVHPHYTDEYFLRVVQYHNKWAVYDEWRGRIISTSENYELANEVAMMLAKVEKRKYVLFSDAA